MADRLDVSEELVRLEAHLARLEELIRKPEAQPAGKALDFLLQEIFREINTIGSKANDAALSRAVVRLKAELEKFREQVQNVE